MKALVYHGPGKKSLDEKPKPKILQSTDAIVRIVKTTICGTDLHILKGDVPTCEPGRILGHEGVGVIDSVGSATWDASMRALAIGGRYMTCGATSGLEVPLLLPRVFFKHHEIIGVTTGSHQEFVQVTERVAAGLPVIVDEVFPLAGYADAVAKLAKGDQIGKLVIDHEL